jgi:hypothetical protein
MGRLAMGVAFSRMSMAALPTLLDDHSTVRVDVPGEISLQVDNRKRTFRDLDCPALYQGAEYLAYYDSQHMDWIHLTDGKGRYIASLAAVKGVARHDVAALRDAMAEKTRFLNKQIEAVASRNPEKFEEQTARIEANLDVFEKANAIDLIARLDGTLLEAPDHVQKIAAHAEARQTLRTRRRRDAARAARSTGDVSDFLDTAAGHEETEEEAAESIHGIEQLF